MVRKAKDLKHFKLGARDGEIGHVRDFYFDDQKWTVRDGDRPIGHVSSALYSPRLEKNIGYAWVPTDRSQLGTEFVVEAPFGEAPALVVSVPFVDPTKVIPKS